MLSRGNIQALIMLLMALGGFVMGLAPQLLVYFSLGTINHLYLLLFTAYAALFVSLALLPLGAAWVGKVGGARQPVPGLRVALLIEAAGLSALWYRLINPFPAGPLIANQQYLPVLILALVFLLAWLFFLFILKKVL